MYKSYSFSNLNNHHNHNHHNKKKKKKLKLILEKKNEEIHIIKDDEKWCLNCRKMTDHGIKNCPNKKIVCMNCNHRGHYKYDCYIYKHACYRCLSYGKVIYQDECETHRDVSVSGCIIMDANKTKILLVKGTTSECWGFPKGASENGETTIECAARETFEETGIKVHINNNSKKEIINNITYYYLTIPNNKELVYEGTVDKTEISDINWINIYDLVQHSIPNINKSVKMFISNLYSE